MKLGFDAKRFYTNSTGLGNYARNLISAMDEAGMRDHITLFSPRVSKPYLELYHQNEDRTVLPGRKRAMWRQVGISKDLKRERIDIYHGLSAELPLQTPKGLRTVVTIHDMLFRRFPTYYSYFDRMIYDRKTKRAVEKADRVIAISEATKLDLIGYYGLNEDKISVIPVICTMPQREHAGQITDKKPQLDLPEDYLLCVSRFERRKNHLNLLKAYASLPADAPPLILAGADGDQLKSVRTFVTENALSERVTILVNPPGEQLDQLYARCLAFVFPSLYEGFGMPVLEAMQYGKVVLTAEKSSMSEITGDAGLLFDPFEPDSIAERMKEISSTEIRDRQERGISERLNLFSPAEIVESHRSIYRDLMD